MTIVGLTLKFWVLKLVWLMLFCPVMGKQLKADLIHGINVCTQKGCLAPGARHRSQAPTDHWLLEASGAINIVKISYSVSSLVSAAPRP